jgi:L-asparaginase
MAITQCHGGSVELGKYETSAQLLEIGVISGHDLTFEASVTKAMFLLGQGFAGQRLENELQRAICGELSKI